MNNIIKSKPLYKMIEEILGNKYYCESGYILWSIGIYKKRGWFGMFSKRVGGYYSGHSRENMFIRCNCPKVAKKLKTHLSIEIIEDF